MHITYNKDLDMFNVTAGVADNTFSSFVQFNNLKKVFIDIWENEDARSLTNAFVGRYNYRNSTSSELPKDILKIVTENPFVEIEQKVWDNNHKKIDKELLLDAPPDIQGTYEGISLFFGNVYHKKPLLEEWLSLISNSAAARQELNLLQLLS